MKELQPIVRNTINKITEDQLHFSSNHGKLNMISKRYTNMNIGHEFLIIIINLQAKRLNDRYTSICTNNALFSRTLEETLMFDALLKRKYFYGINHNIEQDDAGNNTFEFVTWLVFSKDNNSLRRWINIDVENAKTNTPIITR